MNTVSLKSEDCQGKEILFAHLSESDTSLHILRIIWQLVYIGDFYG